MGSSYSGEGIKNMEKFYITLVLDLFESLIRNIYYYRNCKWQLLILKLMFYIEDHFQIQQITTKIT